MQSFTRVVLPIVIVIGLVGGVTFMTQYSPPAPAKARPKPGPTDSAERVFRGPSLLIPERVAVWDAEDPNYGREFELNDKGHFDFWVANGHAVPTRIFLKSKSCTCAEVQLGSVDPAAVAPALANVAALESATNLTGRVGFNPAALLVVSALAKVTWEPFVLAGGTRDVPAADSRLGMRLAVIRVSWEAKNLGPQRISSELNFVGGDPKAAETRLEVPLSVVPAVQFQPMMNDLGVLTAGTVRTIHFVLWSSTRDAFPVNLPDLNDQPTWVFSAPRPLSPEECRELTETLPARFPGQAPTRVRCGYRVTLNVHERLGDHQLDLGPFTRRLSFNRGTPFEADATVNGSVLGDVRVDGGDQIKLGQFPSDLPKTKDVLVTTNDPRTVLNVTGRTPDEMSVTLKKKPNSAATWELKIHVPANALTGPLPAGSSVMLEASGPFNRRVRIPVSGTAYVR